MSGEFDPIKAAGEELVGLTDIHRLLCARVRDTERTLSEAEADHNALLKLEKFVADLVEAQRTRLIALQNEAERRAKSGGEADGSEKAT